jgi:hypothetical protein
VGLGVIGGSVQSQIKTQVKPKPGEIILYDSKGYRIYKVSDPAIVEVLGMRGVKVMYHDHNADYHLFAYVNRVEIIVTKQTLDVYVGHFGWVNEDKIVVYNVYKTVIDEIVDGFADIITKKYVVSITTDLPHSTQNGYGIFIDIDKTKECHRYTIPTKIKAKRI